MANIVFNRGKFIVGTADVDGSTFRLMLVSTGYVENQDHNTVDDGTTSDPLSYEIAVGGYSRQSVGLTAFEDDTNDFAGLDASDVTFSALAAGATIGGGVLYRYSTSGGTTSDTGQDLIAFYDVTDTPTNGGDITIQWASTSAGGTLKLGTTS
jgi:hypothetical protein